MAGAGGAQPDAERAGRFGREGREVRRAVAGGVGVGDVGGDHPLAGGRMGAEFARHAHRVDLSEQGILLVPGDKPGLNPERFINRFAAQIF